MLHQPQRHFTLAEYFDVEELSSIKHEYCNGEIFAMAGASLQHNHISSNVHAHLRTALRGTGCNAFGSDLRIATPGGLYTYPDVSVVCGKVELTVDRLESATNPVVLVEVLSEATRDYDRGEKFSLYKTIPTLREYVLIEQNQVSVECARKQPDGSWITETCRDIEATFEWASLSTVMSCRDVYREVFP